MAAAGTQNEACEGWGELLLAIGSEAATVTAKVDERAAVVDGVGVLLEQTPHLVRYTEPRLREIACQQRAEGAGAFTDGAEEGGCLRPPFWEGGGARRRRPRKRPSLPPKPETMWRSQCKRWGGAHGPGKARPRENVWG